MENNKICKNCGAKLLEEETVCPICGAPIIQESDHKDMKFTPSLSLMVNVRFSASVINSSASHG